MTALLREQFPIPPHLSISAVRDFLACPLLWFGRRIGQWPSPPASPPLAGTALHAAIELHHRNDGSADPELELLQRWQAVKPVLQAEKALGKSILVDLSRSLEALSLYQAAYPKRDGDTPECFFKITIDGIAPPFLGYIDLWTADNVLRDIKSGASKWDQAKVDGDLQATAYVYAAWRETGELLPFEFVQLQTGPFRPVELTVWRTTRTEAQLQAFVEQVRIVFDSMQIGKLHPSCPKGRCPWPEQCELYLLAQRDLVDAALVEAKSPALLHQPPVPSPDPVLRIGAKKTSLFEGRRVLDALGEKDDD